MGGEPGRLAAGPISQMLIRPVQPPATARLAREADAYCGHCRPRGRANPRPRELSDPASEEPRHPSHRTGEQANEAPQATIAPPAVGVTPDSIGHDEPPKDGDRADECERDRHDASLPLQQASDLN